PFFGAPDPFSLDAFFALSAEHHGQSARLGTVLGHSRRIRLLRQTLDGLARDGDATVRVAAVQSLLALDEWWWTSGLKPDVRRAMEDAIDQGGRPLVKQTEVPLGA